MMNLLLLHRVLDQNLSKLPQHILISVTVIQVPLAFLHLHSSHSVSAMRCGASDNKNEWSLLDK